MRTCYVVPGILGSSLHTPDNPTYPDVALWPNPTRLALGEFAGLTLDPAGVGPGPPFGEVCRAGGPLPDYYRTLTVSLSNALAPADYQVRTWGYDWRKAIFNQGDQLATDILNHATPDDPCSIVAHSQGGLVARSAWAVLLASGKSNLVRRIVTLGTPHRGSYSPVLVWSLSEELITQLSLVCNVLAGIDSVLGIPLALDYTSPLELEQVTATWPALYQLLPLVDSMSAIGDPLRAALFQLDNWPADRQLSNVHLLSSLNTWQAFLRNPVSMPPPAVLTTVGGTGRTTPWELVDVAQLGDPAAIRMTESGDSKVALDSSLVLPGWAAIYAASHPDLTVLPEILDALPSMVLAEREPGPPPLSPVENLSGGRAILTGPPFAGVVMGNAWVDCRLGSCGC